MSYQKQINKTDSLIHEMNGRGKKRVVEKQKWGQDVGKERKGI